MRRLVQAAVAAVILLAPAGLPTPASVVTPACATEISVPVPLFDPLYRELRLADNLGLLADPLTSTGPLSRAEMFRLLAPLAVVDAEDELLPVPLSDSLGITRAVSFRLTGTRDRVTPWGVFWRKKQYPVTFDWQMFKQIEVSGSSLTRGESAPHDLSYGYDRTEGLALERDGWLFLETDWIAAQASFRIRVDRHAITAKPLVLSLRSGWKNVRLSAGRESLWWGPAVHGNLLLTSNARPVDHVRIEGDSPWRLPWFLRHLGKWNATWFAGRLDDPDRSDFPNPNLTGARVNWRPFAWFQAGASRTVMFGGDGSGFKWTPGALFDLLLGANENRKTGTREADNDNRASVDAGLYLWPLFRHLPVLDGGRAYIEVGGEDSPQTGLLPSAPASVYGLELVARGVLLRGELADFSQEDRTVWYSHYRYRDGYYYRGRVIGHPTEGDTRQWNVDVEAPLGTWGLATGGWERRDIGFFANNRKNVVYWPDVEVLRATGQRFTLGVDKYLGTYPGRIRVEGRYATESNHVERLGPREEWGVSLIWRN